MDQHQSTASLLLKTKKSRRGAPKVKTGCLTCKYVQFSIIRFLPYSAHPVYPVKRDSTTYLSIRRTRHKKCDEVKPACSQCVNTGRKCDFLSLVRREPPPRSLPCPGAFQYEQRQPYNIVPLRDVDILHFEYFRDVCSKEFSLFFEMPSWEAIFLQAVCTEPCIRHAALAIAALSRTHYQPGGEVQDALLIEYSTKQYIEAIRGLNCRLDNSPQSWELAMLGSILFMVIEVIRGHGYRLQMHLSAAQAILPPAGSLFPPVPDYHNALSQIELQFSSLISLSPI